MITRGTTRGPGDNMRPRWGGDVTFTSLIMIGMIIVYQVPQRGVPCTWPNPFKYHESKSKYLDLDEGDNLDEEDGGDVFKENTDDGCHLYSSIPSGLLQQLSPVVLLKYHNYHHWHCCFQKIIHHHHNDHHHHHLCKAVTRSEKRKVSWTGERQLVSSEKMWEMKIS